jgi:hypothetical protein
MSKALSQEVTAEGACSMCGIIAFIEISAFSAYSVFPVKKRSISEVKSLLLNHQTAQRCPAHL